MITLLDELKTKYGYNNPIFLEDLASSKEENVKIRQYLLRQSRSGNIKKYDRGVYYFSKPMLLGDSVLSAEEVCEKKYINRDGGIIGFYGGLRAQNLIGITTQIPVVYEIISNNASANIRKIKVGNRDFILRHSKVEINSDNQLAVQLLYTINDFTTDELISYRDILSRYIKDNSIDIRPWISYFPKAATKLIEGAIDYAIAS